MRIEDAYVHSIHCMSMQLQLSATFLPSCRSLLCLGLHSCNQSKRGHSQQRNMLKNKQHDAGICCRNAGDVAAAVGQSTTAIRNQSKCQRAKQTSRTDTNTHTHMQIAMCARTPYIKPCSKDFQFIFTKTFFCCRLRFVPRSRSGCRLVVIAFAMANENKMLLVQHGVCTTRRTH